jgi:hypothetical protein
VIRAALKRTKLRMADEMDNEQESDGLYGSMEVTGRPGEDRQYDRYYMRGTFPRGIETPGDVISAD